MADLCDPWGRKIDYLRVSITDRCNLRCQYCMPHGVSAKSHHEILRYEEIVRIVEAGTALGIRKVRITGGEPLVRLGVAGLISQLRRISGLAELTLTTNGILLAPVAAELKEAGLDRVNISLDSLRRERFRAITQFDAFTQAMEGIESALRAGLTPVKINAVIMKGINDDEIMDFVELSRREPLHIRLIEYMPLGKQVEEMERFISLEELWMRISGQADLLPVSVRGNGPARSFRVPGGAGTIGFIAPISHTFCGQCNRLRLTADGHLRPCLDTNTEISLRNDRGEIGDSEAIAARFREAILVKPGQHHFHQSEEVRSERNMFQIGG